MEKLTINIPIGYEIDLEKSNLEEGIIGFKLIQNEFHKLVEDKLKGYVIHTLKNKSIPSSNIITTTGGVFPTKEQADSALALANLQQLMQLPQYNGDWVADWSNDLQNKYIIKRYDNYLKFEVSLLQYYFLAFKNPKIRELFYENHKELIKQYFMIK